MIRFGNRLVLSEVDVRRWTRLTGFKPPGVSTPADLEAFVHECKRYYAEPSYDAALLSWLMDIELERCGGPPAGRRPTKFEIEPSDPVRSALEREFLWNIALGGDRGRREELERLLGSTPGHPE